jgi:hypothetical protein
VFSSHAQEQQREVVAGLANFILEGGSEGRTRTEISVGYFKRHQTAAEIDAELTPLVHDGVVVEVKDETTARPTTRYIHRSLRISEFANHAGQSREDDSQGANYVRTKSEPEAEMAEPNSHKFADSSHCETISDLHDSQISLIRTSESNNGSEPQQSLKIPESPDTTAEPAEPQQQTSDTTHPAESDADPNPEPDAAAEPLQQTPGAPTEHTPGMTSRVQQALTKAALALDGDRCLGCGTERTPDEIAARPAPAYCDDCLTDREGE